MDEKTPSIWRQYGPALAMAGCCLAPALIATGISLAATAGLGAVPTSIAGVAVGGAGLYLWKKRQRAGAAASGMACCPAPELEKTEPKKAQSS